MVDKDGLFISGPAVVKILHDNRPLFRRFESPLRRVGGLLLHLEMAWDALYEVRFMDQADDLHFEAASGTAERVHFPDFLYELPPGLGWHPPRLVFGHIQHGRLVWEDWSGYRTVAHRSLQPFWFRLCRVREVKGAPVSFASSILTDCRCHADKFHPALQGLFNLRIVQAIQMKCELGCCGGEPRSKVFEEQALILSGA